MNNFWQKLPVNFSVLAPMEDVTDTVFRQIIILAGRPDVFFTEFTNCDGICSVGQSKLIHRLKFNPLEQPIVAQIWGATSQNYEETSRLCTELGFSGIDINMGCPERNVTKIGACSALINNPKLAKEIIQAVQKGTDGKIPVSVKTRIGFNTIVTKEWITFLLQQNIQALTIHGRTAKELSDVPNHFDQIKLANTIKYDLGIDLGIDTKIIANGDIINWQDGISKCESTNSDGYMIGRGVFHNPWCFNHNIELTDISREDRLRLLSQHLQLWQETWQDQKHYPKLKKYFKIYCQSFPQATELRIKLMETNSITEAAQLIREALL
jgi:tRNA-dihydrouridine synthase